LIKAQAQDERGATRCSHVLESTHGEAMTFTHEILGVDALAEELERRVVQRALPAALAVFRGGHSVPFGAVVLQGGRGVSCGDVTVPWSEIAHVRVRGAHLCVEGAHGPADRLLVVPIERVPNACVAVAVAEHAIAARHMNSSNS
jgi:hypothetical protein